MCFVMPLFAIDADDDGDDAAAATAAAVAAFINR